MSRYELTGDFVGALKILRNTLQDPIVDKFTSALQIAYEVGGTDLGLLLRNLSEVIREDNKVRGEISARQSWTINGARLAIAAPWLTVLILSTRQSAAAIYLSSQGIRLLLFCAILSFFAYFLMTRLGQLPVAERIAS
jgi:tight adherence protein B